jgi:hypothetical protein
MREFRHPAHARRYKHPAYRILIFIYYTDKKEN